MQIDLAELLSVLGAQRAPSLPSITSSDEGSCVVVLERGFVYQGAVTISDGWVLIDNAKNVRCWGTKNGLGELAIKGPQSETKLDQCGNVKAPLAQLISLLPCKTTNW